MAKNVSILGFKNVHPHTPLHCAEMFRHRHEYRDIEDDPSTYSLKEQKASAVYIFIALVQMQSNAA